METLDKLADLYSGIEIMKNGVAYDKRNHALFTEIILWEELYHSICVLMFIIIIIIDIISINGL